MKNKEFKNFEKEKKLIPVMIRKYCKKHHKNGKELCRECQELEEYALYRLGHCPFKKNKKFCSFCSVHCYKKDMQLKIKQVMRYSGPRMILTHPIFCFSHLIQKINYEKKLKKEKKYAK